MKDPCHARSLLELELSEKTSERGRRVPPSLLPLSFLSLLQTLDTRSLSLHLAFPSPSFPTLPEVSRGVVYFTQPSSRAQGSGKNITPSLHRPCISSEHR